MAGMSRDEGVKSVRTGTKGKLYTTAGTAINLLPDGPYDEKTMPCREWTILEAADSDEINVVYDDESQETLPADLFVGIPQSVALRSIGAGSDSGIKIYVIW